MILISSGALISAEMRVELGNIPSSFVPLGNIPLYVHQVENLKNKFPFEEVYLSFPDNFVLRETDYFYLKKLDIQLVKVPADLSLGDSILYVINTVGRYNDSLKILHGDTYLNEFPDGDDVIAIASSEDDYPWEHEFLAGNETVVWCGFFSFSDIKLFARLLTASRGIFVEAIRSYQNLKELKFSMLENWLDMGHVNTYFRSRTRITTERSFNNLLIKNGIVRKESIFSRKIEAEENWYLNLPAVLKKYVPMLVDCGESDQGCFYELEYLPLLPLNELYVHADLPLIFWKKIFKLTNIILSEFVSAASITTIEINQIDNDFKRLVIDKTLERLYDYAGLSIENFSIDTKLNGHELPSIMRIVEECQAEVLNLRPLRGISHGDFCFSNMLYDSRSNALKLLDPRGMNIDESLSIIGGLRYDSAKLTHSIIGLYDHIIAGLFTLDEIEPLNFNFYIHVNGATKEIRKYFYENIRSSVYDCNEILPLVVLLFLSMIPLHSDKPITQRAFLANALRLYMIKKKGELCL